MKYGCIGEHLGHSFSAEIHHALSEEPYEIREVPREDLDHFLQQRAFLGINVTIPYKEDVIPHLAWMSDQATAIGAVNTIVNRDGRLYGYNTDFFGMQALILRAGIRMEGKRVAVLGTGGTSRTAVAVAKAMGASTVCRVSRTGKDGAVDYENLQTQHWDTQVLINTTPCGMYPKPNCSPVSPDRFSQLEGVVDAIYNPLRSQLVLDAEHLGIRATGGLFMLVAQAVRASELFLDRTYAPDTAERIYQKILAQKENIVLIGMPASGKSSVGQALAERMGRPFFDLDTEIEAEAGCTVSELFQRNGEEVFRDLETQVLRERLAQKNGIVLSTGGGTILRDENVLQLRRNGRLYFLDRPLELLLPTADRPLASSAEAIRNRYQERYMRYRNCADVCIDGSGSVETVVNLLEKEWQAYETVRA